MSVEISTAQAMFLRHLSKAPMRGVRKNITIRALESKGLVKFTSPTTLEITEEGMRFCDCRGAKAQ